MPTNSPACFDHPVLPSDAWCDGVASGWLTAQGAVALTVCRYSCPVRDWCRKTYEGVEVVAGGGWFNGRGKFCTTDPKEMDAFQAAAYLGVGVKRIQYLATAKTRRIRSIRRGGHGGRAWYKATDIYTLAEQGEGPDHGTQRARDLHIIRGEDQCHTCIESTKPIIDLVAA